MWNVQAVVERVWRSRHRPVRGRCRTRVPLPAAVDFPLEVLRALRHLDPMLDGYILPDGRVWILQLVPDRARIIEGRKLLVELKEDNDQREPAYMASLMAEGFKLIDEMSFQEGTSAGAAVRRASEVLHATQDEVNQAMRARRSVADSSANAVKMHATLSDRIRSSARGDWARQWRGRRTFFN